MTVWPGECGLRSSAAHTSHCSGFDSLGLQLPHCLAADKAVYAQDLLTATQNCFDFLRTQLEDISASAFSRDFFAPFLEDFTTMTHREAQEVASHYFNRTQEVL